MTTPGVVSILSLGSRPAPIPDHETNTIHALTKSGIAAEPAPFLREGQRVRLLMVLSNPLEGILIHKKSSCCLVVSIEMLQRSVSVEIDPAHIEAI